MLPLDRHPDCAGHARVPTGPAVGRRCVSVCLLSLLLTGLAVSPPSAQTIHPYRLKGRWATIPASEWGTNGKGTHLAVLRGNADSAWVLHFDGHDGNDPWLWLARPDRDSSYGVEVVLADSNRIFCSGHSQLADGRLLIVGGEVVNHSGPSFAYVFDAKKWWDGDHGWSRQKDMLVDRRYASATTLADGRVLVTSGQRYFQIVTFGGADASGPRDDLATLDLLVTPAWSGDPTVSRPPPRSGHSAVFDGGSGRMFVFGGLGTSGPLDDLWGALRTPVDEGERWSWARWCDTCTVRPPARSRHAAAMYGDTMVVFGGQDAGGQALGDVWRWIRSQQRWVSLATSGGPRRYGHTAVLVPGRASAVPPNHAPQLLVFGGIDENGTLADSTVWALSLPPGGDGMWRTLATGSGPAARRGHTAILDLTRQRAGEFPPKRRMYVFAGEGRTGVRDDVWVLTRPDVSTTLEETWSWTSLAAAGSPPARSGAGAAHDVEFDRMVIFGGDANGEAAGGLLEDAWGFPMNLLSNPPSWHAIVTGDTVPTPRAGHTSVLHPVQLLAREPEIFTVDDAASPPGQWERISSPRYMQYYPHLFMLRSGRLFFSGNTFDGRSGTFDPATGLWSDVKPSGFVGTFSVMFRPDTILKCGNDVFSPGSQLRIAAIDSATAVATWGALTPMPEARAYQSLVLLPTGEVLMTGGRDGTNAYLRNPRLWNSRDERGWGDTLATEPADRQYHSAAVLLPDGRVLASGGAPSQTHGTLFWPPYLFNRDGTPAQRPVITSLPSGDAWAYGMPVTIGVDTASAIGIVCLVRPGSVTHQADFDQRYVRLPFQAISANELRVTGPPTPNHAPPGDYLLFLVKTRSGTTDSIPSVGRWVRLGGGGVGVPPGPRAGPEFALLAPRPNPASRSTTLRFQLSAAAHVRMDVFDAQGRLVRRLIDAAWPAGEHAKGWDLRDGSGASLRSGIYFCRMRVGGFSAARKMVVLP